MLTRELYDVSLAEFEQLQADIEQLNGGGGKGVLAALPHDQHILIAGATGAGKSVLLNGFINELLQESPYAEWLLLIDPKQVELSHLKQAPHTLTYASTRVDIVKALQLANKIMNKRFKEMQKRKLTLYDGGRLHVVIDELANLMIDNKKEVEPLLSQLLILGRAAKISVVACTQRATASVVSNLVKANIVHRVALRTATRQESRNILEQGGAEKLPRCGECIYFDGIDYTNFSVPLVDKDVIIKSIKMWRDSQKGILRR